MFQLLLWQILFILWLHGINKATAFFWVLGKVFYEFAIQVYGTLRHASHEFTVSIFRVCGTGLFEFSTNTKVTSRQRLIKRSSRQVLFEFATHVHLEFSTSTKVTSRHKPNSLNHLSKSDLTLHSYKYLATKSSFLLLLTEFSSK